MTKNLILSAVFSLAALHLFSQQITGTLRDASDGSPITNATVSILRSDSVTVVSETVSDAGGKFVFRNLASGRYVLNVTSIGYSDLKKRFVVRNSEFDFGEVELSKSAELLSAVVLDATPPPVRMRGDTTEMAAAQFKVNPDATVEDLVKKMPGIAVDKQGNVTAQGESVRKVTVDGREFFGEDAAATLRNLPSEIVDRIQVFDRMSDQAQLTGFDDGNTVKAINIVTRSNMRQGNFGRLYGGYGTDDRYMAGGNISFFKNARRISIVGLSNNVNQQNFSSDDLAGMGGGGGRGGYRGGGGFGGFSVGPQRGIARTNSIGVNYNDQWSKKVDASGSYFFNNSNLKNNQVTNTQFINPDAPSFYDETSATQNTNYNNRTNMRVNYKIDSNNTLLFTGSASFQNNSSENSILGLRTESDHLEKISNTESSQKNKSDAYQLNAGVLYSHSFARKGRSLSLGLNTNMNKRNGEVYNYSLSDNFRSTVVTDTMDRFTDQNNNTNNYRISVQYTEPIGPKWQMQFSYNPSFQTSFADQRTYDYEDKQSGYSLFRESLSNKFENQYNTHNAGVTIRKGDRDNMVAGGVSYQFSELMSDRTFPSKTQNYYSYSNLLANMFARLKTGTNSQLRLMYRGSVNPPSITQLQDVINTNNPLFYSTGNPNLQQQYSNRLFARYSFANRLTGKSFFANIFMTKIDNYITNATYRAQQDSMLTPEIVLRRGSQISKPVNLDGHYTVSSFFNFTLPMKFMKSNLNLNAGFGYTRLPGMVNDVKNISDNFNYNAGAVLASNVSEFVDFDLSYSINFNNVENSINPDRNDNYYTESARANVNLLTRKGSFFQTSLSHESYSGLSQGFNQRYFLWNAGIGQKFMKDQRGELKLSVFDLLKQNKSISRTVDSEKIEDLRTEVLQQYFMLTFTYKLRNFGKAPAQDRRPGFQGRPPFMGGMGH